ncbi:hypothetical protein FACS1894137_19030 [Spirochaetia bacterium]|nr:hypothetical protein FACS1894137_19030 [Spirochaetia bacterium]
MKNYRMFLRGVSAIMLTFGMMVTGCATNKNVYQKMDAAVEANSYDAAVQEIVNAQTPPEGKDKPKKPIYKENNQISMYLDKGLLEHYAGNYAASAADLKSAEAAIEDAYTKSVSQDVVSYIANDTTKDYAGEDYEFELQNAYKTPVYSGIKIPAALELTGARGDEKGPLLDIPAGKGQLNVLAFAGLAPYKQEKIDELAFPFLVALYPALLAYPPLASGKLKVPELVERPSGISGVSFTVSGGEKGNLELLEDLGAVITDTFNGHQSSVYLKTYSRVVGKLVVAAVAGKAAEEEARQNGRPEPLALAAGVGVLKAAQAALDATEAADVRSGRYLPGKAYIGAVNLDPGKYEVSITYSNGETLTKSVEVTAGKISLVEAVSLR